MDRVVPPAPILVVEDNDDTRAVLERILAIKGYPTVTARDVASALRRLRSGKPVSLVILDLNLPGPHGRELVAQMKADPQLASIPVVVFSGDPGEVPDAAACIRKGTDDPDVLLRAIEACLSR
jgi:CheY-like chemotaxis protein